MCVWSVYHVLCSGFLVLLMGTAGTRASTTYYLKGQGLKELWPYLRIRCDLHCPYGYETDVEGDYVCLCHDPCKNIRCFEGTRCVMELPKLCTRDYCRPRAFCKDMSPPVLNVNSQDGVFLADDASRTSSYASLPARCRLPRTDAAKSCRKMRVRWYFDDVTGSCRSFLGCKAVGNNFRGQRGCEKTCGVAKGTRKNFLATGSDDVQMTSQERSDVHVPPPQCARPAVPVSGGCKKPSRRWFFDSRSGSCQKFWSCPAGGNNFSRKRHCKNLCLEQGRVRRKGRRSQFRAANQ